MRFRVLDKNNNCLMATDVEKIARRLLQDNPERGYQLIRSVKR